MSSNLMNEPINRFFYSYLNRTSEYTELAMTANDAYGNEVELERLIKILVRESFQAGARWQLHETAKLSPYISKFLEMVILLGPDSPRDAWLEVQDVMPYHNSEFADSELRDDIPF